MGVDGLAGGFFGRVFNYVAPAVGIDIGSHSIKVVVLKRNARDGTDFSVAAGEFFLDSDLPGSIHSGQRFSFTPGFTQND